MLFSTNTPTAHNLTFHAPLCVIATGPDFWLRGEKYRSSRHVMIGKPKSTVPVVLNGDDLGKVSLMLCQLKLRLIPHECSMGLNGTGVG